MHGAPVGIERTCRTGRVLANPIVEGVVHRRCGRMCWTRGRAAEHGGGQIGDVAGQLCEPRGELVDMQRKLHHPVWLSHVDSSGAAWGRSRIAA